MGGGAERSFDPHVLNLLQLTFNHWPQTLERTLTFDAASRNPKPETRSLEPETRIAQP